MEVKVSKKVNSNLIFYRSQELLKLFIFLCTAKSSFVKDRKKVSSTALKVLLDKTREAFKRCQGKRKINSSQKTE